MAGIPKVKIQFDADLDGLKKGTADADKEIGGFSDKVADFGKKAAAAFAVAAAAAAAYAGKLAIDGVRAALEDEKAQRVLAQTLENTTGATNKQIAAVEEYILQTALATGVTDDQLRPAFARLVRSTKDVEEAQKVLNLALDIASATGKPLELISNSLAKAYDGNTNALGRLGLGLDQSIIKSKDFNLVYDELRSSFAGFAANEAQTFQGRIDRLNVAFDEVKETVGFALLPILEKLLSFVTDTIFPVFKRLSDSLSGSGEGLVARFTVLGNYLRDFIEPIFNAVKNAFNKIGDAIEEQKPNFENIITTLSEIYDWANKYIIPILREGLVKAVDTFGNAAATAIKVVVPIIEGVYNSIKTIVNFIIDIINTAISVYNKANNIFGGKDINQIGKIGATSTSMTGSVPTSSLPFGGASVGGSASTGTTVTGGGSIAGGVIGAIAGGVSAGGAATAGGDPTLKKIAETDWDKILVETSGNLADAFKRQNELQKLLDELSPTIGNQVRAGTFVAPSMATVPNLAAARMGEERSMAQYNITVNGAIDPESTARQVVDILNQSNARGTLGGGGLQGVVAL
jgi:hypothetical protein